MFAVQAAILKDRGGIDTALAHYARMFAAMGVECLNLYRGPALADMRAAGLDVVEAPANLTSPLFACSADFGRLRGAVQKRAGAAPILAVVHSDMALGAVRRIAPGARIVAPCHSDKAKRKRRADLVVTLNPAQHELVRDTLAGSHARAAMLGNPFVEEERATITAHGPARLNFCARFIPTKDPLTLMRAASLARSAPPLRFIGAGPLEGELRTIAEASALEVSFPSWRADPFEDFTRGDILVLPSVWEGLPYLLQEALARGVPIIASDIAGNRQALDGGAFGALFAPGDAAALAACIGAALGDLDGLRARAEKGRAALRARYGAAAFWAALQRALDASREDGSAHA